MADDEVNEQAEEKRPPKRPKREKRKKVKKAKLDDSAALDLGDEDDEPGPSTPKKKTDVYLPSMPLRKGEELVCDPAAYLLHHQVQTGYPCLCFDVIPDSECRNNKKTNFDAYIVAGTQAERRISNRIVVMKLENLSVKTPSSDNEDSDDDFDLLGLSDEEDSDETPQLYASAIRHNGAVNRVKFTAANTRALPLVAAWADEGRVGIYDVSAALVALNNQYNNLVGNKTKTNKLPRDVEADDPLLFSFQGHESEGFALDWSPTVSGQLISGDCNGKIHLWLPREASSWAVDAKRPFSDHESSVEDLQWSPTEKSVFCSCSSDASIRVWDVRAANRNKSQLANLKAHSSDVNVIAWNHVETALLLSGGDDGALKVWDFRNFKEPVAQFQHHTGPITSVQWCPHDSSVFAASGEDDQLTLWDCGVEPDDEGNEEENNNADVPPQLLFIHQGQKEIKELRWYPHSEGVVFSVASTGLDVFRTISV